MRRFLLSLAIGWMIGVTGVGCATAPHEYPGSMDVRGQRYLKPHKIHGNTYYIARWAGDFDAAITELNALDADVTLVVDETATASTNVTVDAEVAVVVLNGGGIATGGFTLDFQTHNARFIAPITGVLTGAAAGTVLFAEGTIVYPEWFGVDGTSDEDEWIMAAQSLPATGGTIKAGQDSYATDGVITIAKRATVIAGTGGFNGTVITCSTANTIIDANEQDGFELRGVRLTGPGYSQVGSLGVDLSNVRHARIGPGNIIDQVETAIKCNGTSYYSVIVDNYINDVDIGINVANKANSLAIIDNRVVNTGEAGILWEESNNISIERNIFENISTNDAGNGYAIKTVAVGDNYYLHGSVISNRFECGSDAAGALYVADGLYMRWLVLDGNYHSSSAVQDAIVYEDRTGYAAQCVLDWTPARVGTQHIKSNFGGINLVTNGDCEVEGATSGVADGWTVGASTNTTFSLDTTQKTRGSYSQKISLTGAATESTLYQTIATSATLIERRPYVVRGKMMRGTGATGSFAVKMSTGATGGTQKFACSSTNEWEEFQFFYIPATGSNCVLRIIVDGGASGEDYWFDEIAAYDGLVAPNWQPKPVTEDGGKVYSDFAFTSQVVDIDGGDGSTAYTLSKADCGSLFRLDINALTSDWDFNLPEVSTCAGCDLFIYLANSNVTNDVFVDPDDGDLFIKGNLAGMAAGEALAADGTAEHLHLKAVSDSWWLILNADDDMTNDLPLGWAEETP